jgi:ornithine carbamoyltransferase
MRHFISLLDYSHEELIEVLDRADYLADAWRRNRMPKCLLSKQIGLWFYGSGFRNRLAFEIGAQAMGASVSYIPGELGIHEPLEDIGHYLENWYSILVIRAQRHKDLVYLSENTAIPVINARTDYSHPCEIMGDLQFMRKHRGSLEDMNVVFVGEVTNLCMSWFEAAARFPIKVTQIAPFGYEADKNIVNKMNSDAIGLIATSNDLNSFIDKADLVYTDCWPYSGDAEMERKIKEMFIPYQITGNHLKRLNEKSVFLPCPPVTRGQEVSSDAMDSDLCLNYKAKEYLLHSQNSILEMINSNACCQKIFMC